MAEMPKVMARRHTRWKRCSQTRRLLPMLSQRVFQHAETRPRCNSPLRIRIIDVCDEGDYWPIGQYICRGGVSTMLLTQPTGAVLLRMAGIAGAR